MSLNVELKRLSKAREALAKSEGARQLSSFKKLDPQKVRDAMQSAAAELGPSIGRSLVANFHAAGLQSQSGTMLGALGSPVAFTRPTGFTVKLRPGIGYGKKSGSVYAAAGVFRYGGVRQPLIHKKGDLYKDLPTGKMVPRKFAAGALGDKLKRSVKAAVLKNGKIIGLGRKARDAFERAQDKTRKKLGKAVDLGHGLTVLRPREPFFRLTPGQIATHQNEWFEGFKKKLRQHGVQID